MYSKLSSRFRAVIMLSCLSYVRLIRFTEEDVVLDKLVILDFWVYPSSAFSLSPRLLEVRQSWALA